jgi:phosphate transport system substrate-binding protein
MRKTAGIIAALAIAATALVAAPASATTADIAGGGSSFAADLWTNCATNYSAIGSNPTVSYSSSSSGTGRTGFVNGTFDFAGSDSDFGSSDTKPSGNYAFVPVAGGPIAIIYNLTYDTVTRNNKGVVIKTVTTRVTSLKLDAATIGKIYKGQITKWNDNAIKDQNPTLAAKLPNLTINAVYRNTKSGTNGNFSGWLDANWSGWPVADQTWTTATGDDSPAGTGASSSSVVISKVTAADANGTIGYADLKDTMGANYAGTTTAVKSAYVLNAHGQYLLPTANAAAAFLKTGTIDQATGLVSLNWAADVAGGYNASLFTYALVHVGVKTAHVVPKKPTTYTIDGPASTNGAKVKDFINYTVNTCVPSWGKAHGFVPVTGDVLKVAKAKIEVIK